MGYAAGMIAIALMASSLSLNLTCTGTSMVPVPVETTTVQANGRYGSGSGFGVRSELVVTESNVGFRLEGDEAQISIPAHLLPQIHGGNGGWFKVKNLVVTDSEITGKAAVNFLTNPSFRIDRQTGVMTSSGGYRGTCTATDPTARKF